MQLRAQHLIAQPITPETFQPFGQVIFATDDGAAYGPDNAQLQLHKGIPRFYIMRLEQRGCRFTQITRHQQCTQCLGALANQSWLMAVAPSGAAQSPSLAEITAFQIPGNCFIKLEVGTWHAGPYFASDWIDFYNLELADTNQVDHDTCDLSALYNVELHIDLAM
ncbi:ureidoglycolate lyase [Acaryochloris sp. IP29b_bin.148]|uniref:ureidoglycolate lyase n=1 Tax=Acaryochloris sp. IP29b_bin.148 TaxID=2969218 RepID=UPI0026095E33|nr:ureidoglycolate lyase [Acaryochloris sp. IP29b_bin.148]